MLFHIILPNAWAEHNKAEAYFPTSFESEGFIHLCTETQVDGVLQRYFQGQEEVLLLELDETKLTAKLVFEASTNDELFPHLYGGINPEGIVSTQKKYL